MSSCGRALASLSLCVPTVTRRREDYPQLLPAILSRYQCLAIRERVTSLGWLVPSPTAIVGTHIVVSLIRTSRIGFQCPATNS